MSSIRDEQEADTLLAIMNTFSTDEDYPSKLQEIVEQRLRVLGYLLCWQDPTRKFMLSRPDPELWKEGE